MTNHNNITELLLYGCDGEVQQNIHQAETYIIVIVFVFITITSLFGNIVVVVAILHNQKLCIPKNYLLCSLAVTDMISPVER